MKFIYQIGIDGTKNTSKRGWVQYGVGIGYSKKDEMRMISLNLLFVCFSIGWVKS